MSSLKERFVLEFISFLAKPYNGLFEGECPHLREFATLMRGMRANTLVDKNQLEKLCSDRWLLLTPRERDRDRLTDWRFNPSLVAPLVGAASNVMQTNTTLSLIHETGALLKLAATIESDAEQQRYRLRSGEIGDAVRACSSYQEIILPIQSIVASIAQSNVDDFVVSVEPGAFLTEREGIQSCAAAVLIELLAGNELHLDLGDLAFGPFVITFRHGEYIRTTNPYLALVYAVCQSVLAAIAARQPLDDLRRQVEIAAGWASAMQLSDAIPSQFSPHTFIQRARLLLLAHQREQPLRTIFKSDLPLLVADTNTLYNLVAAEQLLKRYYEAREMGFVTQRQRHLMLCITLSRMLLPTDAHLGRHVEDLIEKSFTDLPAAQFPLSEKHAEMIKTIELFHHV